MTTHNVKGLKILPWLLYLLGFASCLSAYFWLPTLRTSAVEGESFHHLNRLVIRHHLKDPSVRTHEFYTDLAQSFTLRATFLFAIFGGLTVGFLTLWKARLTQFFVSPSDPINLAVFRVVVFSFALNRPLWESLHRFRAPIEDLDPPPGWDFISNNGFWFPEHNEIIIYLFQGFCLLALIGLKTRYTAPLATLFGLFALGVPQLFGKVAHYHHIWFGMLYCALSPSGDALSVDRLLKKDRRPSPSAKYRWPLAWMAVTIGIFYLFPGAWKFMVGGLEWVFSDNLQNKMYTKWFETGMTPPFRIDKYPFVIQFGALTTIVFEALFLFAIVHPLSRWLVLAMAVSFHQFSATFMGVNFTSMMAMYVIFVDWPLVAQSLKARSFDPFKRAYSTWKTAPTHNRLSLSSVSLKWFNWLPAVFCSLLLVCGVTLVDTWPICVYPTFASIEKPHFKTLYIEQYEAGSDGSLVNKFIPIKNAGAIEVFRGSADLQSFVLNLSAETDQNKKRDMARAVLKSLNADLSGSFNYKFYLTHIPTDPDVVDPKPNMEKSKFLLTLDQPIKSENGN